MEFEKSLFFQIPFSAQRIGRRPLEAVVLQSLRIGGIHIACKRKDVFSVKTVSYSRKKTNPSFACFFLTKKSPPFANYFRDNPWIRIDNQTRTIIKAISVESGLFPINVSNLLTDKGIQAVTVAEDIFVGQGISQIKISQEVIVPQIQPSFGQHRHRRARGMIGVFPQESIGVADNCIFICPISPGYVAVFGHIVFACAVGKPNSPDKSILKFVFYKRHLIVRLQLNVLYPYVDIIILCFIENVEWRPVVGIILIVALVVVRSECAACI